MSEFKNYITYKRYISFFIISILIPVFIFWLSDERIKDLSAYLFLFLFGYLIYKIRSVFLCFLLLYFIFYVFFFHSGNLTIRASYMISFVLTCACLHGLNSLDVDLRDYSPQLLYYFILILFLCYIISINPTEKTYDDRIYYHGFVIAHHFAYITAFCGYFLIRRTKIILGLLIVFVGLVVGTRSGILVSLIPVIYLVKKYIFDNSKNKFQNIIFIGIGGIVLASLFVFFFREQISTSLVTFSNFSIDIFSENNEQSIDFTASRSILWALAFMKIASDGFGIVNLTGRGPAASLDFLEEEYGIRLWLHNDFFDVFFCLGIIGVTIYIYCIYRYYRSTQDVYILMMMILAMFTNGFFTYMPIMYIALHILSIKLEKLENETSDENICCDNDL